MLQNAAEGVRFGGWLVYATCSSEPEENDGVVDALLAGGAPFRTIDAREIAGVPVEVVDRDGRFRTTPDQHGLECFFGAVLRRTKP